MWFERFRVPRGFLWLALVPAALVVATSHGMAVASAKGADKAQFRQWLVSLESTQDETAGLYPYYASREPGFASSQDDFLSPMVSAKAILFWLQEGELERARRIGRGLLSWQSDGRRRNPRIAGALPSAIRWTGKKWQAGERYYSGDNLLVLDALMALFKHTHEPRFRHGAEKIAAWIQNVMCRGREFGVWAANHGAPMHFVTANGDFDNRVFTNVELLWIGALRRFGEASGEKSYIEQFEKAKKFLLRGQSDQGVWFDHYDPGYPPVSYDRARWRWHDDRGVVIADSALRAALGAFRLGAMEQARAFADWFGEGRGPIPAYLDVNTAQGWFDPSSRPYYDVVASGLWRTLALGLDRPWDVRATTAFLGTTQNQSGGWFWGIEERSWAPVQRAEAVLTGLWGVSELGR